MNDSALASSAIPACLLYGNNGSGSNADNSASASLAVPCLLTQTVAAAAAQTMALYHRGLSLACSHNGDNGSGAANSTLALLAYLLSCLTRMTAAMSRQRCLGIVSLSLPPHATTVAAAGVWTTEPWHCRLSLTCSHDSNNGSCINNGALALSAIPTHTLINNNGSDNSADNSAMA
jgi:hypothetical protein